MTTRVVMVFAVGCAMLVFGSRATAQEKPAQVSGQVYRSDSGKGFPDVEVSLVSQKEGIEESAQKRVAAKTDAKGNYSFRDVAPGKYRLSVTAKFDQPDQHPCGPQGGLRRTKDGYISAGARNAEGKVLQIVSGKEFEVKSGDQHIARFNLLCN